MTWQELRSVPIGTRVRMVNTAHSDGLLGTLTEKYSDGCHVNVHIDGDKLPSFWKVQQVELVGSGEEPIWRQL